jgi:hypothetical protein
MKMSASGTRIDQVHPLGRRISNTAENSSSGHFMSEICSMISEIFAHLAVSEQAFRFQRDGVGSAPG